MTIAARATAYLDGAPFSASEISLAADDARVFVEAYCNRESEEDDALQIAAAKIAVLWLNRRHTEGLSGTNIGGVSESYIDGIPADIKMVLNRLRKAKVV